MNQRVTCCACGFSFLMPPDVVTACICGVRYLIRQLDGNTYQLVAYQDAPPPVVNTVWRSYTTFTIPLLITAITSPGVLPGRAVPS